MEFPVHKIICNHGCRNGLSSTGVECHHLSEKDNLELSDQFMAYECKQAQPSSLFEQLAIWVDDVNFWAMCLSFDQRLQLHKPKWVRKYFVALARKQLTHLTHRRRRNKKTLVEIFKRRSQQILAVSNQSDQSAIKEDLKYLSQKQLQLYQP